MKLLLPILLLFTSCSVNSNKTKEQAIKKDTSGTLIAPAKDISDPTNTLTGKKETLQLQYIVWGCACANWITASDYKKYEHKQLSKHCIFIEPATPELELPSYFDAFRHNIKAEGQFYTKPDYPKGTVEMEESLEKARVFRYTKIEVLEKNR